MPCPHPGDLPDPGIKPSSLISPAWAGRFFTTSATWEAHSDMSHLRKNIVMTPFAQRTVEEQDFCCFRFPLLQSLFILQAKLAEFQKGKLYNPYHI